MKYQSHCENYGDMNVVSDYTLSGTTGKGLRIESVRMITDIAGLSAAYRVHVQSDGWQGWKHDGEWAGTKGKSLRVEGIQIKLEGDISNQYDVYYRVHIQNVGWMAWAKNGETAGSTGHALRMEAIQICIVKSGEKPKKTDPASAYSKPYLIKPSLSGFDHVQDIGWGKEIKEDKDGVLTLGTTGRSLRLEAIKINVANDGTDISVTGQPHISNMGWCKSQTGGEGIGSVGQGLSLEAIRLNRHGNYAGLYDIYYRVHVQNRGWMGWTNNAQNAGTEGCALRMEAIQIKLQSHELAAPGGMDGAFYLYQPPAVDPNAGRSFRAETVNWLAGHVGSDGSGWIDNSSAWCCRSVVLACQSCGCPDGTYPVTDYCPTAMQWFADRGQLGGADGSYYPLVGDWVFFDWDSNGNPNHVGFVIAVDGSTITTVEGNAGDAGICQLREYDYTGWQVLAYGSPSYA